MRADEHLLLAWKKSAVPTPSSARCQPSQYLICLWSCPCIGVKSTSRAKVMWSLSCEGAGYPVEDNHHVSDGRRAQPSARPPSYRTPGREGKLLWSLACLSCSQVPILSASGAGKAISAWRSRRSLSPVRQDDRPSQLRPGSRANAACELRAECIRPVSCLPVLLRDRQNRDRSPEGGFPVALFPAAEKRCTLTWRLQTRRSADFSVQSAGSCAAAIQVMSNQIDSVILSTQIELSGISLTLWKRSSGRQAVIACGIVRHSGLGQPSGPSVAGTPAWNKSHKRQGMCPFA